MSKHLGVIDWRDGYRRHRSCSVRVELSLLCSLQPASWFVVYISLLCNVPRDWLFRYPNSRITRWLCIPCGFNDRHDDRLCSGGEPGHSLFSSPGNAQDCRSELVFVAVACVVAYIGAWLRIRANNRRTRTHDSTAR